MTQTGKIRVAVLFGGRSAEHEVSLQSAANVIQYLDPERFDIIPIGIDKCGNWLLGKEIWTHSLEHHEVAQLTAQTEAWFTPEWVGKTVKKQAIKEVKLNTSGPLFDVVFPAMHGTTCEDGTLQGLLELANLPYVGSGVLSSAMGMDKDVSKRLAKEADIDVAPFIVIKQDAWLRNDALVLQQIKKELGLPVFVKPANTGSSIGITKVKSNDNLKEAIIEAFQFDTKILIEKALVIQELEVAVLESIENTAEPIVSVVGEIKPRHEFYSYEAKYIDEEGADLLIPAAISEEVKCTAQRLAKKIFHILECEGMARIDLFYEKQENKIYFNEINTLPGFTKISMYPKLMEASGVSYSQLLSHLIDLAIVRFNRRSKLKRSYTEQIENLA